MSVMNGHLRGAARTAARGFATQPRLDVEMLGMPKLTPASSHPAPELKVTTLDNGLRVASQDNHGAITAVGMFIDAGSRYETNANSGTSHLLVSVFTFLGSSFSF